MFKIILFLVLISKVLFAAEYDAEVREIGSENVLYRIEMSNKSENDRINVSARNLEGDNVVLEEKAVLDKSGAEVLEYNIVNNQTNESGKLHFTPEKIWIEYREKNQPLVKKEIERPEKLVTPANFENFIRNNFATLKKEKSIKVNFLVWDRHECVPFKINYLGEINLNGESTQLFSMNISNFILAAFVEPVKIWFSKDMTQIRRYLGRVSVKKHEKDNTYSNLDADVKYTYK